MKAVMVITEELRQVGVLRFRMRAELGELVGGTGALTPVPQAQQTDSPTARHTNRKGALAVTMPWARPLCATRNAVQFATERVCE